MKKSSGTGVWLLLALLCAPAFEGDAVGQTGGSRPARPKTVRDYFRLAPDAHIGYPPEFREYLLKGGLGIIVDVKHGYISYDASDNPEAFEFAIFRKRDGEHVVAYSIPFNPDFSESSPRFVLLDYSRGRWKDVTRELLPEPFDRGKKLTYKLPRRGRQIIVTDEQGRRQYGLTWQGDRFLLDAGRAAATPPSTNDSGDPSCL